MPCEIVGDFMEFEGSEVEDPFFAVLSAMMEFVRDPDFLLKRPIAAEDRCQLRGTGGCGRLQVLEFAFCAGLSANEQL